MKVVILMIPIGETNLYTTTVETTGRYNLSYGDDDRVSDILIIDIDTYDNMDPCGLVLWL
jgi:hypothetical protein